MTAKAAAHAVVEPLMMYDIKMDGKTRFQKKKKKAKRDEIFWYFDANEGD